MPKIKLFLLKLLIGSIVLMLYSEATVDEFRLDVEETGLVRLEALDTARLLPFKRFAVGEAVGSVMIISRSS